ncbi:hypothetical protein LGH93_004216, partial [Salmonella enterica subsp. enterica serovar Telelkebir]|nr:hypothetical protein [Salmonella enterica subsp. enterica serovar Telelkebir]
KKINKLDGDNEELSCIDLAINVATKLSISQIRYISLIHFAKDIIKIIHLDPLTPLPIDPTQDYTKEDGDDFIFHEKITKSKAEVYNLYKELYTDQINFVFPDDDISTVDYSMLIALGCVIQTPFCNKAYREIIKKRTNEDLSSDILLSLKTKIDKTVTLSGIDHILLTSVGRQIANAYISTKMRLINL